MIINRLGHAAVQVEQKPVQQMDAKPIIVNAVLSAQKLDDFVAHLLPAAAEEIAEVTAKPLAVNILSKSVEVLYGATAVVRAALMGSSRLATINAREPLQALAEVQ